MASTFETYSLIGTGERLSNADGTSRQAELAQCAPGERIEFVREQTNPHDPMAVALLSARGVQVWYLAREDARWVGGEMDGGRSVCAIVKRVASKGRPDAPLALTIEVRFHNAITARCAPP